MTKLFLYLSKAINGGYKDVIVKGVINPEWFRTGYLKDVTVITTTVCAQLFFYENWSQKLLHTSKHGITNTYQLTLYDDSI